MFLQFLNGRAKLLETQVNEIFLKVHILEEKIREICFAMQLDNISLSEFYLLKIKPLKASSLLLS